MPVTKFAIAEKYKYLEGFGNYHQSADLPGANPIAANSPQLPPYSLTTERISGSAFTAPRAQSLQTWLYRTTPSIHHGLYTPYTGASSQDISPSSLTFTPNALRMNNFPLLPGRDWISSQILIARAGDPRTKTGLGYLVYAATQSMPPNTAFSSSDGDYLIVPQAGTLDIQTEVGHLLVRQGEVAMIPRGIRYRVTLPNGAARGYICELYHGHFQLPELGPIGSCSLANVRDFQIPVACFDGSVEDGIAICPRENWTLITKYIGSFHTCSQASTPFNVAAWHGTYYPYKYDLGRFSVLGSTSYDHPDPSIFTVLTAPSHREPGTAVVDFAILPPRWQVMEDTYWEPYSHRNSMSEFAGVILNGEKKQRELEGEETAFRPFGALLNGCMVPHGMDGETHERARRRDTRVHEKAGTEGWMVFLWESELVMGLTEAGAKAAERRPRGKGHDGDDIGNLLAKGSKL